MTGLFSSDELMFDPILPAPLIGLLAAILIAVTLWQAARIGPQLSRWQSGCLAAFRAPGIGLVFLLLLQPSRMELIVPPVKNKVLLLGVDTSLSMKQPDAGRMTRLEAAKNLLVDGGVITGAGLPADPKLRAFEFSEDAVSVTGSLLDLKPKGTTTRVHKSVTSMLDSVMDGESARALILLTDGHDFELVNPTRTGMAARQRGTPIYAVPLGRQGKVRDVSVRMLSYQPYTYVKQKARLTASLRLIGCEFEDLQVQLLRRNQVVQVRRLNAGELPELPVEFEVTEPQVGQYEYEIRVTPLEGETDTANNSTITYLNVIDQQIQVLVLEGSPYWDSTFLQRSLMGNDKFQVDSIVRYGERRIRAIRRHPGEKNDGLKVPETLDQFAHYDVIVLGRNLEELLGEQQLRLLTEYVQTRSGTVIFSRGPAFQGALADNELEPVIWGDVTKERTRLQVSREGGGSALRTLGGETGAVEGLPEMLSHREIKEKKSLTATLATAGPGSEAQAPALVHRRFGSGQIVSVGVEGLWRWGFNANVSGVYSAFDRFWDQLILWLLAGRDFTPASQYSFRTSTANVQLGEKAYFRVMLRAPVPGLQSIPLRLLYGDAEVARMNLAARNGDATRFVAEFLPEKTGRYRAIATLPGGATEEVRFIVFTENLEETEVATDVPSLKRLCESSGGRLLAPEELARLLTELKAEKVELMPNTRIISLWDRAWIFYLIGLLFGAEWYLRRRWGLS
jgi:hypothetical protein